MTTNHILPAPNGSVVAPSNPSVESNRLLLAGRFAAARDDIVELVRLALHDVVAQAETGVALVELEAMVGRSVVAIGQHLLAFAFASACRTAMRQDVDERGLVPNEFRLRTDDAGYITVHTTFGPITFPIFAYRDISTPAGSVTRSPGRVLFPYHRSCRSSPLCLQWEARLGLQHPFRKAEEMMHFFTRGVSTIEDTTISRHMLVLSQMIEPEWLYRTPEDLRDTLRDKATRDKVTGCPIVYVSSDAHALRRYVGDTWALQWKMVNGIRVWCEDADTGQFIHLGGEFTWGDCREVGARIRALRDAGILPNDDAAWAEVNAQVVFVSDGSAWLLDHIVPVLGSAIVILDPYHLIDWFAAFTKLAFGAGSKRSRELHAKLRRILFNKRPKGTSTTAERRRGHKKTRGKRTAHAYDRPWAQRGRPRTVPGDFTAKALLELLADVVVTKSKHVEALDVLAERLANNTLRIDYPAFLARGLQIGSGAMESMHRTGSQLRLKLPGASWLEDSSQAVLHFRMLELSGRWHEFWNRPNLVPRIAKAFATKPSSEPSEPPALEAA